MVTTILSTVLVLGILIFIHELGHFLVAKYVGVTVQRFSLGFGPKLIAVQRGETEYCLSAIPLGGYVKMLGEDPDSEVSSEELPNSFSSQLVSRRMAIVFAGPFSNLILAIFLFAAIYTFSGIPQLTTEIGEVTAGSPAAQAGLQAGDQVLEINGKRLKSWEDLSLTVQESGSAPLQLEVKRGEKAFTVRVNPKVQEVDNIFGESVKRPLIGVTASGKFNTEKVNPLEAVYYSLVQTWNLSKLFFLTIVKLIQRVLPMETLGGPILIAQMAGQQAREGLINLVYFTALISVNLAILNLLPIPILDGGHLFFFIIEAIMGKPVSIRKIEMAQRVGMFLLLLLMILVFYNDIMRLMPGKGKEVLP